MKKRQLIFAFILEFSLTQWLNDSQISAGPVLEEWVVEHLNMDLKLSALLMNPACDKTSYLVDQNNWNTSSNGLKLSSSFRGFKCVKRLLSYVVIVYYVWMSSLKKSSILLCICWLVKIMLSKQLLENA